MTDTLPGNPHETPTYAAIREAETVPARYATAMVHGALVNATLAVAYELRTLTLAVLGADETAKARLGAPPTWNPDDEEDS